MYFNMACGFKTLDGMSDPNYDGGPRPITSIKAIRGKEDKDGGESLIIHKIKLDSKGENIAFFDQEMSRSRPENKAVKQTLTIRGDNGKRLSELFHVLSQARAMILEYPQINLSVNAMSFELKVGEILGVTYSPEYAEPVK